MPVLLRFADSNPHFNRKYYPNFLPALYCLFSSCSIWFGFYFCSDNPRNLNVRIFGDIISAIVIGIIVISFIGGWIAVLLDWLYYRHPPKENEVIELFTDNDGNVVTITSHQIWEFEKAKREFQKKHPTGIYF